MFSLYTVDGAEDYSGRGSVEYLTREVAATSGHLLRIAQDEGNKLSISPLIPYALYQCVAASLQSSDMNRDGDFHVEVQALVTILTRLGERWNISSKVHGCLQDRSNVK